MFKTLKYRSSLFSFLGTVKEMWALSHVEYASRIFRQISIIYQNQLMSIPIGSMRVNKQIGEIYPMLIGHFAVFVANF